MFGPPTFTMRTEVNEVICATRTSLLLLPCVACFLLLTPDKSMAQGSVYILVLPEVPEMPELLEGMRQGWLRGQCRNTVSRA
jgi:hypothetical protein